MHIVGLRYFNVYGMGESKKGRSASVIYQLIQQMKEGSRPKLFFDGEQKRDHVYIKDVVSATILATKAGSGIYNVGSGVANSYNRIVDIINEILGQELEPLYSKNPYEKTYQNYTQADISKFHKEVGYVPKYSLKEGIKDYVKNCK
jgi:ADP-L-glycero-D-manno-heptose 6-epimerase